MTQDEIIEMARQAAAVNGTIISFGFDGEFLEAFAKLVAAKEREACANFCEAQRNNIPATGEEFAAAIRARGEAA